MHNYRATPLAGEAQLAAAVGLCRQPQPTPDQVTRLGREQQINNQLGPARPILALSVLLLGSPLARAPSKYEGSISDRWRASVESSLKLLILIGPLLVCGKSFERTNFSGPNRQADFEQVVQTRRRRVGVPGPYMNLYDLSIISLHKNAAKRRLNCNVVHAKGLDAMSVFSLGRKMRSVLFKYLLSCKKKSRRKLVTRTKTSLESAAMKHCGRQVKLAGE